MNEQLTAESLDALLRRDDKLFVRVVIDQRPSNDPPQIGDDTRLRPIARVETWAFVGGYREFGGLVFDGGHRENILRLPTILQVQPDYTADLILDRWREQAVPEPWLQKTSEVAVQFPAEGGCGTVPMTSWYVLLNLVRMRDQLFRAHFQAGREKPESALFRAVNHRFDAFVNQHIAERLRVDGI